MYVRIKDFIARKRSFRRLCFHRCLSVHSGRGVCPIACLDTPRRTRNRHPRPEADTHPPPGQTPLPCVIHAGRRSTSGWYASHWNAFLFCPNFTTSCGSWWKLIRSIITSQHSDVTSFTFGVLTEKDIKVDAISKIKHRCYGPGLDKPPQLQPISLSLVLSSCPVNFASGQVD